MAKKIIDEFGVKPSGLFASWRYIRVLVDENGIIYNEDVPGEPSINLDRISDYKKNNRRYNPGDQIDQFCNFTTFTKYTVKATDERPFAVTTDELNATSCGYETPLPQPAVPFNPFGNPTYSPYRSFTFCDYNDIQSQIIIEKKDYSGSNLPINLADEMPVILQYKDVDDKFEPIRTVEAKIGFIEVDDFELEEFYTEDERTFRVKVIKDDIVEFMGYIIPDSCLQAFSGDSQPVFIRATDAIGSLKTATYPLPLGSSFNQKQSFVDVLCFCLAGTNLNLNVNTICNLYSEEMPNGLGDDPLSLATINPLRFADDKGTTLKCYDVLNEVCKAWGAFLVQDKGSWNFVRVNELSLAVIRQRTYNYTGFRLSSQNYYNKRIIGGFF